MFWLIAAIGIGIVALAHSAPFPFLLEWIGPGRSVWHAPRQDGTPTIYLTYDDGPNPRATPDLLDVLARERVAATFFVIPKHISDETAPILRRMIADGHAIGLHSHTREPMLKRPEDLARQLAADADRIAALAGGPPCKLFRPHAGWRGGQMYEGLERADHRLAGWSFGMWDFNFWRPNKPEKLASRLAGQASDGDIVVMHDGDHKNPRADRSHTVRATAELIPLLRKKGLTFGRICDVASPGTDRAPLADPDAARQPVSPGGAWPSR
jgi:peptidoglycan/xylan/chitin deacetylase (PgdA/CDA1 family)